MTRSLRMAGTSALLESSGASTRVATEGPEARASALLAEMVRVGEVPGIQYLVVTKDAELLRSALGVRDASTGQPMEHDTLQMAYSTSKAITAIAIMQLVEAGRIDLDGPLDAYYREHPYGGEVTIRSLLAQTSGAPNPMPLDWFEVEGRPLDPEEALRRVLAAHPGLVHRPGSKYRYSNLSYWLLEKAVEGASGRSYEQWVRERILEPLAIAPRTVRFALGPRDESATGHAPRYSLMTLVLSGMTRAEYWADASGRWRRVARLAPHGLGYGGLFASGASLAAILQDLLREQPILMSRETRARMLARQATRSGAPIDMTLGWVTGRLAGARYFGKQGGGLGFHGNLRIYPDRGIATVMLANRTEVTARPIDRRSDRLDAIFVRDAGRA